MFYTSTYLMIHKAIHVSGLLISLWFRANPFFVPDKYVTSKGNQLLAGYVEKQKHVQKCHLRQQLAANNTCVLFNGELLHT